MEAPSPHSSGLRTQTLIQAIQQNLTPDLLKPRFREGNKTNPLFGHCYHSAEALYKLIRELGLPAEYLNYRPCRGVDEVGPHWWLQNDQGAILDPTAERYKRLGRQPPYASGRFRPFIPGRPCRATAKLV